MQDKVTGRSARQGIPLYQQLADWLREDIASGVYPTGTLLPTVPELAEQFQVGKHTVRESLAQLKDAGIVSIRRRGGTRVEGLLTGMGDALMAAFEVTSQYSLDLILRIEEKQAIVARREVAELLQCPPGQQWLKITGYREGGDPPHPAGYTEVFIHNDFPKVFERINRNTRMVYPLFRDIYAEEVIEFRQEARAVRISGPAAKTLSLPEGTRGLRYVTRFISSKGIQLEVAVNTHPLGELQKANQIIYRRPVPAKH